MVKISARLCFCFEKLNVAEDQRRRTADKLALATLCDSQPHHEPTLKTNEATHELWYVFDLSDSRTWANNADLPTP
ncbi:hypothetical protein [Vibrio vulnificus]|uniref:hypothetical protein n=1 Tax=Vibrio vulnificus TaxID=672 RepID=UPI0005F24C87|nr:hypothetical protein [Vibrio vulnificus]MDF5660498.1 hypothetical protein [Vibrio parahaemolyticus]